jgi:hypothetical protein
LLPLSVAPTWARFMNTMTFPPELDPLEMRELAP